MSNENATGNAETIPIKKLSKEDLDFQKLLTFANLARLTRRDLNSNEQAMATFHKNFNKDDVMRWMANPAKFEKQLRKLSRFLYDTSSHYKRLIQYFATMLTFDYYIEPYGLVDFTSPKLAENMKKKYIETANFLEVMNMKHEFLKVCERAWIDDVAYFYELRLKDSYFLFPLDPDYCAVSGIEDGCLTFSFDFSYFKRRPKELDRYPEEFQQKYEKYKVDNKNYRYQEINPSRSICIKIAESVDYPIPPFCGIFEEVYALEDYKSLNLSRAEMENYLLLVAKIPYLNKAETENAFALGLDKAIEYFDRAMESLPPAVGGFLSVFDSVEPIKVDKNDKSVDYVSEAQKALYDSAGVSQLLFNGDSSASTISKSIIVDENVVFKVLRQFERWVNTKLKDEIKGIKFRANFLDITKFSQDDYIKSLKEGVTLGLPNKLKYAAALGQSPSSVLHMEFLENTVFDIVNIWKPLNSSYTQSGVGGRPEKNEDDLSPEGETTRKNDSNNKDARG